jgi:secondary thiamine-phosphate synthase enzyme
MASTIRGMSAVCHKEGTDPCKRHATSFVTHITASVFINDDERGLHADYEEWLEELAPHEPISRYRHNRTGEDNGDAHLKRQVMGREVVVAITDGRLDFGPWEQIFYGEFDGRRRKRVLVKIIGE